MAVLLVSKEVGKRMATWFEKGILVAGAHGRSGEDQFLLRVYLRQPNWLTTYLCEVRHMRCGKLIEAWCSREGYTSKGGLVRALREHRLNGEDGELGVLVGGLCEKVCQQVDKFDEPEDEWSALCGRSLPRH